MNEEDNPVIGSEAQLLLDAAWGLIANAGWNSVSGNVELAKSPGWHEAAVRWRAEYFDYVSRLVNDPV